MKPKQAYRIHMILRYLCISCVFAFGVISIIGSGGGGGDGGGGGGGSAPDISNFNIFIGRFLFREPWISSIATVMCQR